MSAPYGYFHIVGKIYEFLVHLAVVLGGMISLFWLAGSLFLYGQLGRPAWEWAILVAVSLFGFCWFCDREFKRRRLRAAAGKPADDDNWGEGREELEVHHDSILALEALCDTPVHLGWHFPVFASIENLAQGLGNSIQAVFGLRQHA